MNNKNVFIRFLATNTTKTCGKKKKGINLFKISSLKVLPRLDGRNSENLSLELFN